MITCKEDLINTYIENDFGELRFLYIKKAIELGFAHQYRKDREVDWYDLEYIGICTRWGDDIIGQTDHDDGSLKDCECRKITLSDLKPTKQYAVLHKGGSYSFQSDKPIGDDVVACFDLAHSEKPLSEDFFDENRQDDKQMKKYKTYQEAKIANPEREVYEIDGRFETKQMVDQYNFGRDSFKLCKPSDHCTTVEEFLKAGRSFDIGDLFINCLGQVVEVNDENIYVVNTPHEYDKSRHVLRAAALGVSDCAPSIHTDSEFYKKPSTKVDFVKVDDSIFDLRPDFEAGELFYRLKLGDEVSFRTIESMSSLLIAVSDWNIYRRIETEIDERQEFIDAACDALDGDVGIASSMGVLYDSGKFKLVN